MLIESDPQQPAQPGAQASPLDVMNFLNEVAERYPAAISFASGRPAESLFALAEWLQWVPQFIAHQAGTGVEGGAAFDAAYASLAQYGRTNGIINALIARQIAHDYAIDCAPQQILVTAGCQEALDLLLTTLCRDADDVVLVRDPCYIGITGVAALNRIGMVPFDCDDVEQAAAALRGAVAGAEAAGKRPRALYLVPDFDNPTGTVLPRQAREDIIAFCAVKGIVIMEDNPYGMFRYEGEDVPAMAALDRHGVVVFLGTYSKTLCPTLRIGFMAVPCALLGVPGGGAALLGRISQAKSFGTVNTSQLTQAVAGAVLLHEECSLRRMAGAGVALYRRRRDAMLARLEQAFAGCHGRVSWNRPQGGFFLCVDVPFPFGRDDVAQCAQQFGVLVMPLDFFALGPQQRCRVRLAFSYASEERIAQGVDRFAAYVHSRLAQMGQKEQGSGA